MASLWAIRRAQADVSVSISHSHLPLPLQIIHLQALLLFAFAKDFRSIFCWHFFPSTGKIMNFHAALAVVVAVLPIVVCLLHYLMFLLLLGICSFLPFFARCRFVVANARAPPQRHELVPALTPGQTQADCFLRPIPSFPFPPPLTGCCAFCQLCRKTPPAAAPTLSLPFLLLLLLLLLFPD